MIHNLEEKKITKKLFEELKNITKNQYSKIQLTCRRDYEIDGMWQSLGFKAKYEKDAKTKQKRNTVWVFEYDKAPLIELITQKIEESKIFGIIEYEIFSGLFNGKKNLILSADWLELDVQLCVTDDFYNQINKIEDQTIRNKQREFIPNFHIIEDNLENLIILEDFLKEKFISLEEFELKHLLTAINLKKLDKCFITLNNQLLSIKDEFFDKFGLWIKSPDNFVNELDNITNEKYQPVSLAGINNIHKIKLSLDYDIRLLEVFINNQSGEDKQEFNQKIRSFLGNSEKFECYLIESYNNNLALIVYQKSQSLEFEVPLLRINNTDLIVSTLAKHIIFECISNSYKKNLYFTKITDKFLSDIVKESIEESRFIPIHKKNEIEYIKANINIIDTSVNLANKVIKITENLGENYNFYYKMATILREIENNQDYKYFLEVEKHLFPAKITDVDILNFIIPIKPFWSQNLFDYKLANTTFLGVSEERLALNTEAVYYKSKQAPKVLKMGVKGRILWYVSGDKEYNDQKQLSKIRACSYLDEVIIGKAEDLYCQFRNLGIYKESDVFDLTFDKKKGIFEPNKEIMAIKFSHTELFDYPIELKKIQKILEKKVTMQSTILINNENFAIIYKLGTQNIE